MNYKPRITRRSRRSLFPWKVHPIWRGIGCIMAILIPALSFALAAYIIANMQGSELVIDTPPVTLPGFGEVEDFWLILGLGILLMPGLFLVLGVFGAMLYSAAGGVENERLAKRQSRDNPDFDQDKKR